MEFQFINSVANLFFDQTNFDLYTCRVTLILERGQAKLAADHGWLG